MILLKRRYLRLALFAAITLSAAASYADVERVDQPLDAAIAPAEESLANEADAYILYMPYSSVENMEGKIGICESGFEYDRDTRLFGKLPVYFALNYDYMNIDKTVPIPLPVCLMNLGLDIETRLPLLNLKGFYVGIGITPSFSCDSETFGADSFLIPTRVYLIYKISDRLILAGGAVFFTDFENNTAPIGGIIYKPNDRLAFNLISDDPNITYKLNDKFEIRAEGGYSLFNQFKVHRQSDNNVLLEYSDMRIGGGVNFKPFSHFTASVSAGGDFVRRFEYPDAGGKMDIDKGMYVQGKIQALF
jgi:hypothetical protein